MDDGIIIFHDGKAYKIIYTVSITSTIINSELGTTS